MLDHLLETGARKKKSNAGAIASAIVHVMVVGLAVAATVEAKPAPQPEPREVPVPWLTPVPATVDRTSDAHRGASGRTNVPIVPLLATPGPIDVDTPTLPQTDLPGPGSDVLADIERSGTGSDAPQTGGTGAASATQLDSPVRVLDERVPAYPPSLRSAGITGSVTAQFVVDTAGRVEMSSLRVLSATHPLFARSVAASLEQARFTPGEVSGRRVRTLVERSFRFDLER